MLAIAQELADLYRGTTTNAAGDVTDDNATPTASGFLFVSTEQPLASRSSSRSTGRSASRASSTYAGSMPRDIRYYAGRVPASLDVRMGDRIIGRTSGYTFLVDAVGETQRATMIGDRRLDLRRVL